jgi:uncharacterized protein YecT (DUF1311 family)
MILALLIALQSVPDDPAETICYEQNQSQQGMNACAAEALDRADSALDAEWAKVLALHGDDSDATTLLLDGQSAWMKYRDAQCEIEAFEERGGSIWPLINAGCLARLSRERTAQLIQLLQSPE